LCNQITADQVVPLSWGRRGFATKSHAKLGLVNRVEADEVADTFDQVLYEGARASLPQAFTCWFTLWAQPELLEEANHNLWHHLLICELW